MSFPLIQDGSLTLPSGTYTMCFAQTSVSLRNPLFNVAGACEGAAANHASYVHGIPTGEYVGVGFIKETGEATYGLAQASSMNLSTSMNVKSQSWRVRRSWQLFDVTGSSGGTAESAKTYTYGLPSTSLSVAGVAEAGYVADHANNSLAITTVMSQFGTLAGTLKLSDKMDTASHASGGPVPVRFGGEFSTKPTFTPLTSTGTNDDFEWLLGSAVVAPVEGTLTLDIGDATDLAPNVLVHSVELSLAPRDGGSIRVKTLMKVTA